MIAPASPPSRSVRCKDPRLITRSLPAEAESRKELTDCRRRIDIPTDSRKKAEHQPDEIIREVREIRETCSARHGHDAGVLLRKARVRSSE